MNNDIDLSVIIQVANAGIKLLTARLFTLIAVLSTAGLFAWAVYEPTPYRIAAAGLYALFALQVIRMTREVNHETVSGN